MPAECGHLNLYQVNKTGQDMKIIWEETDIKGGIWIYKPTRNDGRNEEERRGHHITTTWMVSYDIGKGGLRDAVFSLVSLADGMISVAKTASDLVMSLNEDGYIPLPPEKLVELVQWRAARGGRVSA